MEVHSATTGGSCDACYARTSQPAHRTRSRLGSPYPCTVQSSGRCHSRSVFKAVTPLYQDALTAYG